MTVKESPHEEYDRGFSNGWDACAARTQPAQAGQAQDLMALIDRYWELAYAEGKEGRDHDTVDGAAADCRRAIKQAISEMRGDTAFESAQAGKVLTDDQWQRIADITQTILTRGIRDEIEAVLAKRVPMTEAQMLDAFAVAHPQDHADMQDGSPANAVERIGARNVYRRFERGVRAAELYHGIVGEKGGA